jgi:hypothetical protein
MCELYEGFGSIGFMNHDHGATIPNSSVTIGRTSLVGVGHPRSELVLPLMLHIVCYAMARVLALYYRSHETVPTLLRMGYISGRPYMRVTIYNELAFFALK